MTKKIITLVFVLLISTNIFASTEIDKQIGNFVELLKKEKYEDGIIKLLTGSALEEKVINVKQTKTNWINQFTQIKSIYGKYLSFEKVKNIKLGKLEKTYYLVYCEIYPIQIIITEYDNGKKIDIINMEFDDQVLSTLDTFGIVQ